MLRIRPPTVFLVIFYLVLMNVWTSKTVDWRCHEICFQQALFMARLCSPYFIASLTLGNVKQKNDDELSFVCDLNHLALLSNWERRLDVISCHHDGPDLGIVKLLDCWLCLRLDAKIKQQPCLLQTGSKYNDYLNRVDTRILEENY